MPATAATAACRPRAAQPGPRRAPPGPACLPRPGGDSGSDSTIPAPRVPPSGGKEAGGRGRGGPGGRGPGAGSREATGLGRNTKLINQAGCLPRRTPPPPHASCQCPRLRMRSTPWLRCAEPPERRARLGRGSDPVATRSAAARRVAPRALRAAESARSAPRLCFPPPPGPIDSPA